MSITKKIPVIPEAYKELNDSTLLNSRDVAKMFGYKNINTLATSYQRGNIPKPDKSLNSNIRDCPNKNSYWTLGTIRKWGKELN